MKLMVEQLMEAYMQVEQEFQHGQHDKCVGRLFTTMKSKDDYDSMVQIIFSHSKLEFKNKLIVKLIVSFGFSLFIRVFLAVHLSCS